MEDSRIARCTADVLRLAPIDGRYRTRFVGAATAPADVTEWEAWDVGRDRRGSAPRLWSVPSYLGMHSSRYDEHFVDHEIDGPLADTGAIPHRL